MHLELYADSFNFDIESCINNQLNRRIFFITPKG
jgi:hypothetical protein